jgi:chromosome segregation ATPase
VLAATNWVIVGPLVGALFTGMVSSVGWIITFIKNRSEEKLAQRKLVVEERSVAATEIDKAIPGFSVIIEQQRIEIARLNEKVTELEEDRTRDRLEMGRMVMDAAEQRAQLVRLNEQLANETARRERSEEAVGTLQRELGAAQQQITELRSRPSG